MQFQGFDEWRRRDMLVAPPCSLNALIVCGQSRYLATTNAKRALPKETPVDTVVSNCVLSGCCHPLPAPA